MLFHHHKSVKERVTLNSMCFKIDDFCKLVKNIVFYFYFLLFFEQWKERGNKK